MSATAATGNGASASLTDAYQKLNLAVSASVSDLFLIGGFSIINVGGAFLKQSITPSIPAGGWPRTIVLSSIDAAIDISKLILYDMSVKHGT